MTSTSRKVQNEVLNSLRKSHQVVTIFLMNGFQMKGIVRSFDEFCVVFRSNDKDNMIYKHAISTIDTGGLLDLGSEASE